MNLIKKINWNNAHVYFFFLFLFSIPFQTRKVFLTEYSFYSGVFTEYTTFFVYISDILLILTLILWLVFNKNLYFRINTLIQGVDSYFRGNNRSGILYKIFNIDRLFSIWSLLFIFIIWLAISAVVNNTYIEINIFYILKFIEFSLLIFYIYFNLRNRNRLIIALFAISFAGFFQGLMGIYQFIYQCPLFKHPFLHKLVGESTVYPQLPGIAKIIIDNEKFVRAYGAFPHPNILGGFLIVSIVASIYLLLEHKKYILSMLKFKYNNTNNDKSQVKALFLLLSLFWIIFIFTQITALFFTFSRTAWMGFLVSLFLIVIFYIYRFAIVSRETIFVKAGINCYRLFYRFKELFIIVLFTLILIIAYSSHINSRINEELLVNNFSSSSYLPSNYAFNDRIFYNNVSRETISENFIFGSGPGTFIFQINSYLAKNNIYQKLEPWQYQPAHNIYLLIISEIGIIGFAIFALFIIKIMIYNLRIIKKSLNKRFFLINNPDSFSIVSRETIEKNKTIKNKNFFIVFEKIKINVINLFKLLKNKLNNKIVSRETIEMENCNMFSKFRNRSNNFQNSSHLLSEQTQKTLFTNLSPKLNYYLLAIFISFLLIGLFDHYFWTLQQGRLIFWLILGLMLINNKSK